MFKLFDKILEKLAVLAVVVIGILVSFRIVYPSLYMMYHLVLSSVPLICVVFLVLFIGARIFFRRHL